MGSFFISEIQTQYRQNPLGLDCVAPHFSWKIRQENGSFLQSAYRIRIGLQKGLNELWDSGKILSEESVGIRYQGAPLLPCTRYYLTVTVWNEAGESSENKENWFETGLMDETLSAWEGANWIGAPEKYIRAQTLGVFELKSRFRISEGSKKAGIVFGAGDPRLLDARRNQYQIAGENYIRYEIDVSEIPAKLRIYRVGYHPDDRADVPFAQAWIVPFNELLDPDLTGMNQTGQGTPAKEQSQPVITLENRYQEHEIRIRVVGNCAFTYIDDILVDAENRKNFFGSTTVEARQLNPLGFNDVTTFPRLCEIGYYAGPGDTVRFPAGLEVYNERTPNARILWQDADGILFEGGETGKQCTKDPSKHSLPMFQSCLTVSAQKVKAARLYLTARGIYDCSINAKPVTKTWLNPGLSQYDHHLMYQTYDVTEWIREGENHIQVTLASGWWCDAQTFVLRNYNYFGDQESFLGKLVVTYEDGSRICRVTNTEDWEYYGEGPWLYAGLFQGEHYDARRTGWEEARPSQSKRPVIVEPVPIESYRTMPPGFGRAWPKVDHSGMKLVGGMDAPVEERCRVQAKAVSNPREGLYIYDLGQEIAGVPSILFHGEPGEEATIRYGEMLYPDLPQYQGLEGMLMTENYRDAESIDHYILKGSPEGEVFCPRFTFHGFRYIEMTGVRQPPELREVEGIQLSSVSITGKLETSNPLLNRFIENVKWSQLCNFISIPTDCPQRNERMGWAGDAHVFCRTATCQSDARIFYERYLQMLQDLQEEDGQLPEIAPLGGGFGGITYECAMIFMAWELYQQYGAVDVIETYYDSMRRWVELTRSKGFPGPVWAGPINDWLAPEKTDDFLLWNAFYYRSVYLLGRMAQALEKTQDAELYLDIAAAVKVYWNETFVEPETGKMRSMDGTINDTQCAYALPLAYGIVDDAYQKQAYAHLAEQIIAAGCTVQTGFFGTGVLNPMLSAGGYGELAYELMQQTAFPSWLYSVTQGATTIWERWDSYTREKGFGGNNFMNSFNHYSLGSVLSWMYEWVLGIQRDEEKPGYRHFFLCPMMQSLDYARGGFETVYGRIESSWEKTETGYRYECVIPCNTTATLTLKNGETCIEEELKSGSYRFEI